MAQRLKAPERREVIYRKAKTLFARMGVAGTTTAAIASAVGVSEPILYRHFGSKQKLFDSLLSRVLADVTSELAKHAESSADPVETLERIAIAYVELSERYKDEFLIINRCLLDAKKKKIQKKLLKHYQGYVDLLTGIIREGQAMDQFRSDISAEALAWHVIRSALGYVVLRPLTNSISSFSSPQEEILEILFHGIFPRSVESEN